MKLFSTLLTALCLSLTAPSAQAQEDPYIGKTFAEMLQLPDFRAAYLASLKRTPIRGAGWAMSDAKLPASVYIPGPDSRNVIRLATCAPRACASRRIDIFFDPLENRVWLFTRIGTRTGWSGGINPFLKKYFEPHLPKF